MRSPIVPALLAAIALSASATASERIKAIQTLKITRTIVTQFSELEVVVLKKRPHSFRVEQNAPGQPAVVRAVTPDAAWDLAGGKLTTRTPQAAAEARDLDGDFDGPLVDWKEKGHTVALDGREPLPGGDAFKLQVTTKNGVVRTFYIDASTYLVRRITGTAILPGDRKAKIETDILGYKEAGGVKFPADIQEDRTGAGPVQTIVTYTKAIEINVPIDDALFAAPQPPASGPGASPAASADQPW
jgi:hypothetical protein